MAGICKDCGNRRIGYRHRLRCLVGAKFLKALDERLFRKLRLPAGFVSRATNAFGNRCYLFGPKMELYLVRIKKEGNEWSFKDGWRELCATYNLGSGYSIRLKYVGGQCFETEIYDMATEELVFKLNAEEMENRSAGAREIMRRKENYERDGRTEVKVEPSTSGSEGSIRRVGRPAIPVNEWEEGCATTLYGTSLKSLTKFHLRYHLRMRDLPEAGGKQELMNRLGKYIAAHGEA